MKFNPASGMVGGFTDNDGTIDFYLRINSLIKDSFTVLDLGAGRAGWFEDDLCETRRTIRLIKGKVKKVIAADVDIAVYDNKASDEQVLIIDGSLNVPENSVDIVIADYVLEHIEDPAFFSSQVNSCLKSGGWFCARTPHKFSYVSFFASVIKNSSHSSVLRKVQPNRREVDVFPTKYRMNTLKDVRNAFADWHDSSFIYKPDPAYFFGNRILYKSLSVLHRLLPAFACGNLFVFLRKP